MAGRPEVARLDWRQKGLKTWLFRWSAVVAVGSMLLPMAVPPGGAATFETSEFQKIEQLDSPTTNAIDLVMNGGPQTLPTVALRFSTAGGGNADLAGVTRMCAGCGWYGSATTRMNLVNYSVAGYDAYARNLAAFSASNGTATHVYYARQAPPIGVWQRFQVDDSAPLTYPSPVVRIVGDLAAGNITVAWLEDNVTLGGLALWTNASTAGVWGGAQNLDSTGGDTREVRLAMDGAGVVTLVWARAENGGNALYVRQKTGSSWGPAAQLVAPAAGLVVERPALAVDTAGAATLLWEEYDSYNMRLMAAQRSPGGVWSASAVLVNGTNPGLEITGIDVDRDGRGGARALWVARSGGSDFLHSSSWTYNGGWGPVEVVDGPRATIAWPDLAVAADGSAFAVWATNEAGTFHPRFARTTPSLGWHGKVELTRVFGVLSYLLDIAVIAQPGGALVATVETSEGTGHLIMRDFVADDQAPTVSLVAPKGGASLNESPVTVSGVTEPGAEVQVNGVRATVQENGTFSLAVPLRPGYNEIAATAVDAAGNRASALVVVLYDDPVPGLQYQLEVAQARVDALEAALFALQVRTGEAEINLSVALDRIRVLMDEANVSFAQLSSIQSDLDAAEARVLALELDAGASRTTVEQARAEVNATRAQFNALKATLDANQRVLATTQSELMALQAQVNNTIAQQPPPAEESPTGTILGIAGVVAGLAGVAVGALAMRKAGAVDAQRQTPKRDFGDRMKAGLTDGETPGEAGRPPREPGA